MAIEITQVSLPALRRFSVKGSQYDFAALRAGTTDCITLQASESEDIKKVHSRLSSAVTAYRKRSGVTAKFTVRTFTGETGTECVGVWKLAE